MNIMKIILITMIMKSIIHIRILRNKMNMDRVLKILLYFNIRYLKKKYPIRGI